MPLTRWIISSKPTAASEDRDAIVNTLYFNVSGSVDDPDYDDLGNDLWTVWTAGPWAAGSYLDIRGYDMSDPKPREQKFARAEVRTGSAPIGPPQIALCLSYYADRNLNGRRGRIYVGPWNNPQREATVAQQDLLIILANGLAGIGGLNVDWSLYKPTTGESIRISNCWVDSSWDVIRSRKIVATRPRQVLAING